MKILTNVQTNPLGGIGQTFSNFVNYVESNSKKKVKIVGVEICGEPNACEGGIYKEDKKNFELLKVNKKCKVFADVLKDSESVEDIKNSYQELIDTYKEVIKKEKPDVILVNGTYFVPWCLFMAGSNKNNQSMVLHYHGILTKETEHMDEKPRKLVNEMEKTFDNDRLFYVFPSELAKETVENEVFGHKICQGAVLPNPVPEHFFDIKKGGSAKNVGLVSRWSNIKNPNFVKKLVRYNHKRGDLFRINVVTDTKKAKNDVGDLYNFVKLIKPMNNQRLAKFYGNMGVVLSPSFFETYGNVAQEAVACGTPALVSSNMGVAETFKKLGLKDWVVDFRSTAQVYKKVGEINRQEVSGKVRDRMKQVFTPDKINGKLLNILKKI